ncbi:MAG: hypothetical protein COA43_04155 [Robiginitomaculum sp.]|nr:MAG: hypothetical protein COA43_04155 [Robiginitomaculum sp.]
MAKHTQDDIESVADAMRRAKKDPSTDFAFITGAGCSLSAGIPLASTLAKEIQKKHAFQCRKLSGKDKENYGKCMANIDKKERIAILAPYLKNAKVNWAHIAIASMLEAGYIDRILTFNFDSVLARACGMVGQYPAVYDYGSAASSSTDHIVNPAIIHLHGQGHGHTLLNTGRETEQHVKNLRSLLQDTFDTHKILIVGYSGQSDAAFEEMNTIYNDRNQLFWAGFEEKLPHHITSLLSESDIANYIANADADFFLMDLARELGCFPPVLMKNPYEHLLKELKPLAEFPFSNDNKIDYAQDIRVQLEQDKTKWAKKGPSYVSLLAEGAYQKIIDHSKTRNTIPKKDKSLVAWAYEQQAIALNQQAFRESKSNLFIQAREKRELALNLNPNFHESLYNWGVALAQQAQNTEQIIEKIKLYKQATEKYKQAIKIKPDYYKALYNWGSALADQARNTEQKIEKIKLYKQATEKYKQAIKIKPNDQNALYNWGNALADQARNTEQKIEKIKLYKQATEKYKQVINIKPDYQNALYNWGNSLFELYRINGDKNTLIKAKTISMKLQALKPEEVYSLACAHALLGEMSECQKCLETCKVHGTLPDAAHLASDPDLESVWGEDWFKALLVE